MRRFWVSLGLLAFIGVPFTASVATAPPAWASSTVQIDGVSTVTSGGGLSEFAIGDVFTWSLTLDLDEPPSSARNFKNSVTAFQLQALSGSGGWDPSGGVWVVTPVQNFNQNSTSGDMSLQVAGSGLPSLGGRPVLDLGITFQFTVTPARAGLTLREELGSSLAASDFSSVSTAVRNDNFSSPVFSTTVSVAGASSASSASPAASENPGTPGIFLAVNPVLVGKSVEGAPIYCGAASIQPNSTYTLSVQSVTNSALTRTVLDSGTVNSRGHLDERVLLGALKPGSYKIVMTGIHASGYQLVLTNYLTVGANGSIVSVSAESQQPFLN